MLPFSLVNKIVMRRSPGVESVPPLELRWSKTRIHLYLTGGGVFLVLGIAHGDLAWWERSFFILVGIAALLVLPRRLQNISQPVLVISPEGVWDSRLTPSLVPWSVIAAASFEPKYFRGGAILIDLEPGAPTPDVHNPHFATRGQDSSAQAGQIRLTLYDLSFQPDAVREALKLRRSPTAPAA